MSLTKEITISALFTALLIAVQVALSFISGIELVSVLLLTFSYYFGVRRGITVASAFSILRCLIFGFFPSILILYLIYYNLFALCFGLIGKSFKRNLSVKKIAVLVAVAIIFTICFTLLDDVITPLFYGYSTDSAYAYFIASFYALIPHTVCVALTVALLTFPLIKAYKSVFKW